MNRDYILRMAREQGLPETETEGVFRVNTDDLGRMIAAEREACERLKHSIREAMYLLDQPEPRSHAAFSELLCALNPKLRETKEQE